MADIASSKKNIQTEEASYRSAVSESLMQKIGGAINYLNDTTDTQTTNIATNTSNIATKAVAADLFVTTETTELSLSSGQLLTPFQTIYTVPANTLAWVDFKLTGAPSTFFFDIVGPTGYGYAYNVNILSAAGGSPQQIYGALPPGSRVNCECSTLGSSESLVVKVIEISFK